MRLSMTESDRLYRLARIVALCPKRSFQDKEAALYLLSSPQESLEGYYSFDLLQTYVATCAVEKFTIEYPIARLRSHHVRSKL